MRNVWRNFLHVGNRFSLTGCACCAKMPASSSEIFTKAGSCRNKLNRTTSNFTTEMKTACGVIKNQASNRQKNVVTVYPESESHSENFLCFPSHFHFHISEWFGSVKIAMKCACCLQKASVCLTAGKPGLGPTESQPARCLCTRSFFPPLPLFPTALTREPTSLFLVLQTGALLF